MKKIYFIHILFLSFFNSFSQSILSIGSTTVLADTIFTGLNVPWEILYGSDDQLWVTERHGLVSRIDPIKKTRTVILDLTAVVFNYGEPGLLGMAFHPDFPAIPEVFLVYNYGTIQDIRERLVKYQFNGSQLINPVILIDSIKGSVGHDGSRLLFMKDKTLLMTMGEAHNGALSQDMSSLNGKILRLNTNGTVPADNPFPGSYVYTWGHRNPQGLTMAPNGIIYTSEHGATTDDEFQILEKGRNYGWPDVEGYCDQPAELPICTAKNIKEPILDWTPTLAVGDIIWYSNYLFPELDERMLMVTLKAQELVAIKLNASGTASVSESAYLKNMFGRLRAVCIGPESEIYIATNGADAANIDPFKHSIIVLRPPFPPVGINTTPAKKQIRIFPTIVTDQLSLSSLPVNSQIIIADLSGRILINKHTTSENEQLSLQQMSTGLYLVRIDVGGKTLSCKKIIKE